MVELTVPELTIEIFPFDDAPAPAPAGKGDGKADSGSKVDKPATEKPAVKTKDSVKE